MSRPAFILCLLLCASFLLAPFTTLHMHLAGDQHHSRDQGHAHSSALLHGGHSHDFDPPGDAGEVDPAVDVNFALSDHGSTGVSWTDWLPLLCAFGVAGLGVLYATLILRPPRAYPRLPSHLNYWRPPLRGPPLLSIKR